MIQMPYFNPEEIEEIINDEDKLANFFKKNSLNEGLVFNTAPVAVSSGMEADEEYDDEGEEYEDEIAENENDVENMTDKEKIKLAYEILSMTSYEDDFFMGILGRLRKLMRS